MYAQIFLGMDSLFRKHPDVHMLTTEINNNVPIHFGYKYFGTD